jgi:hypothetical protein
MVTGLPDITNMRTLIKRTHWSGTYPPQKPFGSRTDRTSVNGCKRGAPTPPISAESIGSDLPGTAAGRPQNAQCCCRFNLGSWIDFGPSKCKPRCGCRTRFVGRMVRIWDERVSIHWLGYYHFPLSQRLCEGSGAKDWNHQNKTSPSLASGRLHINTRSFVLKAPTNFLPPTPSPLSQRTFHPVHPGKGTQAKEPSLAVLKPSSFCCCCCCLSSPVRFGHPRRIRGE